MIQVGIKQNKQISEIYNSISSDNEVINSIQTMSDFNLLIDDMLTKFPKHLSLTIDYDVIKDDRLIRMLNSINNLVLIIDNYESEYKGMQNEAIENLTYWAKIVGKKKESYVLINRDSKWFNEIDIMLKRYSHRILTYGTYSDANFKITSGLYSQTNKYTVEITDSVKQEKAKLSLAYFDKPTQNNYAIVVIMLMLNERMNSHIQLKLERYKLVNTMIADLGEESIIGRNLHMMEAPNVETMEQFHLLIESLVRLTKYSTKVIVIDDSIKNILNAENSDLKHILKVGHIDHVIFSSKDSFLREVCKDISSGVKVNFGVIGNEDIKINAIGRVVTGESGVVLKLMTKK